MKYKIKGDLASRLDVYQEGEAILYSKVKSTWIKGHFINIYDKCDNLILESKVSGFFLWSYKILSQDQKIIPKIKIFDKFFKQIIECDNHIFIYVPRLFPFTKKHEGEFYYKNRKIGYMDTGKPYLGKSFVLNLEDEFKEYHTIILVAILIKESVVTDE